MLTSKSMCLVQGESAHASKNGQKEKCGDQVDSSPNLNRNNNRAKTSKPRRDCKNKAVTELIFMNDMCIENQGRTSAEFCKELNNEKEQQFIKKAHDKGETLASKVVDEILEEHTIIKHQELVNVEKYGSVSMEFEDIGCQGDDDTRVDESGIFNAYGEANNGTEDPE
eukprot:2970370-Ditylum_brightwellii.AAC.1